jgi:glycerol-3-phosphate acyltransferase PlsX
MTKIGYLFARGGFSSLREKLDPRRSNGGVFLGLNGVVIKSHGGTDSLGFAAAIDLGYDMAHYDLRTRIGAILSNLGDIHERVSPAEANSVKSGATAAADGGNR